MASIEESPAYKVEALGPAEQRVSFRVGDSWCRAATMDLGGGIRLATTTCSFEPSFAFEAVQPASEIDLIVSRGGVLRGRTPAGLDVERGGNALQLGRADAPTPLRLRPATEAAMACAAVATSEARLRELLGVAELPDAFHDVTESENPFPLVSHAVTPAMLRLLDELLHEQVKGPARLVWHRAKSLELVALVTDALADASRAERAAGLRLSPGELAQLDQARAWLVDPAHARRAGAPGGPQRDQAEGGVPVALRRLGVRLPARGAHGRGVAAARRAQAQRDRGRAAGGLR